MSYPKRVTLEFTNDCNRTCTGCPRHKMTYPKGYMSIALFLKVTAELPCDTVIVPFFRGESLLHPYFNIMMPYLKRFKEVQLATNADFLTPKTKATILDTCTFVSVSLHSYLFPHKTNFLGFLKEAKARGITTQVSIVESLLHGKHSGFTAAWMKHADRVRIYKEHSGNGFGSMGDAQKPRSACSKPFTDLVVYWDGKVGLCNHDWNGGVLLGDLNEQRIRDVWNDKPYQEVRSLHQCGNRIFVGSCTDCSFESNKVYGELIKVKT